jgi:hypothetical protein
MKITCVALLLLCGGAASTTTPADHRISSAHAKALVLAALSPSQRKLPKLESNPDNAQRSAKFMFFTVTWAGVRNGSVVVGNYAVDPFTADVFNSTRECYEKRLNGLVLFKRGSEP